MKILLIQQEQEGLSALKTVLRGQFLLESSSSMEEGEYLAETNEYALVILAPTLASETSKQICRTLRMKHIDTPLLVLSPIKTTKEQIATLDAGADGFLSVPVQHAELITHIKVLMRRSHVKQIEHIITIDGLVLDTIHKKVTRDGKLIQLRRKEYDLLEYFMRNPGRIISREMILNHVWTNAYEAYTNTIDVHVKYLRDQIDKPFERKLIKTIHGFGYKIDV